ncbi:MAG: type I 3-dehydroquinate dehydratase [Clostridiales bacterium]|nr:type I 3-dehydroquinate dehydratase [Clostridiales bacterium]
MKKTFELGTGIFGSGLPKICVPIVAADQEEIWRMAEKIAELPVDLAEWRADFYRDIFIKERMLETLEGLKRRLEKKALLFTFRTKGEGGELPVEEEVYYELNRMAAASGHTDLVDVEVFLAEERTAEEIQKIQETGCHVIASNHDFQKTPPVEELVRRLRRMEVLGADVAKLAVMPQDRQDVLDLLQASLTADEELKIPVVTISMGSLGAVSRITGKLTGSAMTFASVGESSAPGQIPVSGMTELLEII